jgi:predicted nucleotide-binding protein (sugar kinase/HSP70/actin superfamily)
MKIKVGKYIDMVSRDIKVAVPVRIGLPKTLYYYLYPALWETFFKELGIQTIVSESTTQNTVSQAELLSESDHCLILKLLDAHFAQLAHKVDTIFIPRISSGLKDHISCPKLGAIPDTAFAGVLSGRNILSIEIDERKKSLDKSLFEFARRLGADPSQSRNAVKTALDAMLKTIREKYRPAGKADKRSFLLMGHPYLLYDEYFSGPIIRKMTELGVHIQFPRFRKSSVAQSHIKWDTSNEIYEQLNNLTAGSCAGVIQLSCFNCGCDSLINEFFRECLEKKGILYMVLVLDGHASNGWLDTRIEAFIESIGWENAANSSAHDG